MTAKAKSGPVYTFKKLFEIVAKDEDKSTYLATAEQYGWLTDGQWATKITDKDKEAMNDLILKVEDYRKDAIPIDPVETFLPEEVGSPVKKIKETGKTVTCYGLSGDTAIVNAKFFRTMRKRHPEAAIYLSKDVEGPVLFSERSTVAVLPQVNDEPEEEEEDEKEETI